jgi:hypothetical protein
VKGFTYHVVVILSTRVRIDGVLDPVPRPAAATAAHTYLKNNLVGYRAMANVRCASVTRAWRVQIHGR